MEFLSFSSTFSKIAIASSDSRFFNILTIASDDKYLIISVWTDSLSSINTSGSILKLLSLIKFSLSFSLNAQLYQQHPLGAFL